MKNKETLEEAVERLMPKTIISTQNKAIWRVAFERAIKWQAKRNSENCESKIYELQEEIKKLNKLCGNK